MSLDIQIRDATPGDRAFIASTWIRSYADHSGVARSIYRQYQPALVDSLLDISNVRVACSPDTPTSIHAWVCGDVEKRLLHYVYCPLALRGNGLAKLVIADLFQGYPKSVECSHRWPSNNPRFLFNPYTWMR